VTEDKAVVNSVDPLGNTPLLWAVMGDHDECVKILLDAGTPRVCPRPNSRTPKLTPHFFVFPL
jgi:ankyrin repeat protein